jgi:DNA-binding protein HU-beta
MGQNAPEFAIREEALVPAMSKSETLRQLSDRTGLQRTQVREVVDELVSLAYKEAKNGFTIPGLGKLVLQDRKARMGRNPATGEQIQIPAKRVLRFRIAKQAKDAVLTTRRRAASAR